MPPLVAAVKWLLGEGAARWPCGSFTVVPAALLAVVGLALLILGPAAPQPAPTQLPPHGASPGRSPATARGCGPCG